ncbi:MAG: hypothetical protein HFE98_05500 [Ruminiclostridium sp.]|nr:hypothetical protein [Ruminiclostridium sp.]
MTKNRIIAITLAMTLILSLLSGCSSVPGMGGTSSSEDKSSSSSSSSTPPSTSEDASQPDGSTGSSDDPFYVGDMAVKMFIIWMVIGIVFFLVSGGQRKGLSEAELETGVFGEHKA